MSVLNEIAFGLIAISTLICFLRIIIGPTLADRIIALDLIVNILISAIAVYSVVTQRPVYLDLVIAMALIIFLGTVSFAKLIESHARQEQIEKEKQG